MLCSIPKKGHLNQCLCNTYWSSHFFIKNFVFTNKFLVLISRPPHPSPMHGLFNVSFRILSSKTFTFLNTYPPIYLGLWTWWFLTCIPTKNYCQDVWMMMKEMLRYILDVKVNRHLASHVWMVIYKASYHHSWW